MSLAVIGYTGFVGGTICRQTDVTEAYNSQNIEDIRGRCFDAVVCAGAPGTKWRANREPTVDLENIGRLIASLRKVRTGQFVLISTIDVFPSPAEVDEYTPIDSSLLEPYGLHRYFLEISVTEMFPRAMIVRLPGLFGIGLKKNFVYDLLNNNALHLTHHESTFQFYDMQNLWEDIRTVITTGLPVVNFAAEPVKAADVACRCFGFQFSNRTETPAVHYDMRTQLAMAFGGSGSYLYSAEYTFAHIRQFANSRSGAGIDENSNFESRVGSR